MTWELADQSMKKKHDESQWKKKKLLFGQVWSSLVIITGPDPALLRGSIRTIDQEVSQSSTQDRFPENEQGLSRLRGELIHLSAQLEHINGRKSCSGTRNQAGHQKFCSM
jgi:hypothetical protein